MPTTNLRLVSTVLGTPEPRRLAEFYGRLLGWPIVTDEPGWVTLRPGGDAVGLSFQLEPDFVPPVWPPEPGAQQMNSHLDIRVDDLEAGVAYAIEVGAIEADHQPQPNVRVMLDPVGHPFCLFER